MSIQENLKKIESLTEAMAGVLAEQRALQAYAVDFIEAFNRKDVAGMMKAFGRSSTLYGVFLGDFKDKDGVSAVIKKIEELTASIERVGASDVQDNNKRKK